MRFMTVIKISSFFLKFIPRSQDRSMTLKKTANNVKWKQVKFMSSLWQSSLQAMDKLQNCFMTQLGDWFVETILYHHEKTGYNRAMDMHDQQIIVPDSEKMINLVLNLQQGWVLHYELVCLYASALLVHDKQHTWQTCWPVMPTIH